MLYLRRSGPFRPRCASSRFRRHVTFPTYVHRYPRPVWSLAIQGTAQPTPTSDDSSCQGMAAKGGGADEGTSGWPRNILQHVRGLTLSICPLRARPSNTETYAAVQAPGSSTKQAGIRSSRWIAVDGQLPGGCRREERVKTHG